MRVAAVLLLLLLSGCTEPAPTEPDPRTERQPTIDPIVADVPFSFVAAVQGPGQAIVLGPGEQAIFLVPSTHGNLTADIAWTCGSVVCPMEARLRASGSGGDLASAGGASPLSMEATGLPAGEYIVHLFAPAPGATAVVSGNVAVTLHA